MTGESYYIRLEKEDLRAPDKLTENEQKYLSELVVINPIIYDLARSNISFKDFYFILFFSIVFFSNF